MRQNVFTTTFFVAFALWFTATRYASPFFYGWAITPVAETILRATLFALFCAILLLVAQRGARAASVPWLEISAALSSFVVFDLLWRLVLSRSTGDLHKLTSIAIDIATPVIAALGLLAFLHELKTRPNTKG